jgi:hypothetical protein
VKKVITKRGARRPKKTGLPPVLKNLSGGEGMSEKPSNEADTKALQDRIAELEKALNAKPKAEKEPSDLEILAKEPRVKVMIHEQDGFEGGKTVKLSINGRAIEIMRGKEVMIGVSYLKLLDDTKYTIIGKDEQGNDYEREVKRFAYTAERKVA